MKRVMWWKNKRTSDFTWSKQLSVGNAILDSEHRNLIAKINNIMRLLKAGDAAALPGAFELLETWLITHFENEEIYAQAINFDFKQHELAHQRLLNEIQSLRGELTAKNWSVSNSEIKSCYTFLHDWLIGHITGDDMQMKPALQNFRYDYIPYCDHAIAVDIGHRLI